MTESEKVIKALECCEDIHRAGRWASGCIACPYAETEEKIERCDLQLLKDAAALLKEQDNCENCAMAIEDRQPIVRCKDCRRHGTVACPMCTHYIFKTASNWFCADGEAKE